MTVQFEPPHPTPQDRGDNSPGIESDDYPKLLIELIRDFWKLKASIYADEDFANNLPDNIKANIDRFSEDLDIAQVEVFEPTGNIHKPGIKYNISHIVEGEGQLKVVETLIPGVRINNKLEAAATVILGYKKPS